MKVGLNSFLESTKRLKQPDAFEVHVDGITIVALTTDTDTSTMLGEHNKLASRTKILKDADI